MDLSAYIYAAPEMTLLGLICVVLVADLFVDNEHRMATFWMAMASLGITLWTLLSTAPETPTMVFSNAYVSDALSQVLKVTAVGFVGLTFLYSRDYLRANDLQLEQVYDETEYIDSAIGLVQQNIVIGGTLTILVLLLFLLLLLLFDFFNHLIQFGQHFVFL